jgi:hypothetical protein
MIPTVRYILKISDPTASISVSSFTLRTTRTGMMNPKATPSWTKFHFVFIEQDLEAQRTKNLIAKHPDGTCRGDLGGWKPSGCKLGWHAKDEYLRGSNNSLANKYSYKLVLPTSSYLDPTSYTTSKRSYKDTNPQALKQNGCKKTFLFKL